MSLLVLSLQSVAISQLTSGWFLMRVFFVIMTGNFKELIGREVSSSNSYRLQEGFSAHSLPDF